MTTTYGVERAHSSHALTCLLANSWQLPENELAWALTYRAMVLDALHERSELAVPGASRRVLAEARPMRTLANLVDRGPALMTSLLQEYPRFRDLTVSPLDAFDAPVGSRAVQAWRAAARGTFLGTEALLSCPSWTLDPARAWRVVADIANTASAIAALDLGGVLPVPRGDLDAAQLVPRAGELRITATEVSLAAEGRETAPDVDTVERHEPVRGPVTLRGPKDLVAGTRALDEMVQRHPLSIKELRTFAITQAQVANRCAQLVHGARAAPLRKSFLDGDLRYRRLAAATARTASVNRPEGRQPLQQLLEIRRVVGRIPTSRRTSLNALLSDFHRAQQSVAVTLSRQVERHLRAGDYLVMDEEQVELAWRRALPGESVSLDRASSALRTEDERIPAVRAESRARVVSGPSRSSHVARLA